MMGKKTRTPVFFFSFLMALAVGTCLFVQECIVSSALSSSETFHGFRFEQSKAPFEKTADYLLVVECKDVLIKQLEAPTNDNGQLLRLRVNSLDGMLFQSTGAKTFFIRYRSYSGLCHPFQTTSRFIYYLFEKILI